MKSLPCREADSVRELLRLRQEDRLTREGAGCLRSHLSSCASCRGEALREDPTLLFAPLAADETGPTNLEGFVAGVLEEAAFARSRRRRAAVGRRHRALGLAAAAVLGASLTAVFTWHGRQVPKTPVEPIAAAPASAPSATRSAPPAVEGFESPGAQVYQFTSSSPGEPTVVFVVDRNADI